MEEKKEKKSQEELEELQRKQEQDLDGLVDFIYKIGYYE